MAELPSRKVHPEDTSAAGGGGGDPPTPEQNLSPEDEIHAWLRYLLAQSPGKMPMDDIGQATYEGGVAEGYRQYLEKVRNNRLVITARTWASQPESQAYKDRQTAFQNNMLKKLRKTPNNLYKAYAAGPFEDMLPGERAPRGILSPAEVADRIRESNT
ncbi:hypothetical protein KFL_005080070 [Klebsormidium nitens]|uniref:Uncharacterized protein n=1 Tax=Klebsormidium nitens TaxID=105231 RepID=A0A1Y1IMF5_KLENI|nr:hypothetical protein KFL_005080070 [Klebsormidium nitens]|eukprot:GAQ89298.1 hypothetical protein KFL_005080070 [Klebsormidium nitens]